MHSSIHSILRTAALAASLLLFPTLATATDAPADRAIALLAAGGSVAVQNAGPFVEIGSYRIQVSVKLGLPSAKLADGTWLYSHYQVESSAAAGTLVVRFNDGRVSDLIISP